MTNSREPDALNESNYAQLRDRYRRTSAFYRQTVSRGTVCLSQIQSTMESIGLDLPPEMPLASFTQLPSKVNHVETKHLLSRHQETLLTQMFGSFKTTLTKHVENIQRLIQREGPTPDVEQLQQRLKNSERHWVGFDPTALHEDPFVLVRVEQIHQCMDEWWALGTLGPESISEHHSLYAQAEGLWQTVSGVLAQGFVCTESEAAELIAEIGKFTTGLSASRHIEVEPKDRFTVTEFYSKVSTFNETLKGAIPYKLQRPESEWTSLLEELETLSEQDVLDSSRLSVAEAVESYVHYCWFLHEANLRALTLCNQIAVHVEEIQILTAP